jgi:hypothetical protein
MFADLLAKLGRALRAVQEADLACRELGIGLSPEDALREGLAGLSDEQLLAVEQMAARRAQDGPGREVAAARLIVPADSPLPSLADRAQTAKAKREPRTCDVPGCGVRFPPFKNAKRCEQHRGSGAAQRVYRARKAQRETAALLAQHQAEGHPDPIVALRRAANGTA